MLGISRKDNERVNMEIEAAATLILLVTCKQCTMPGLIAPKSPTLLVSIAVDIWGVYTFLCQSHPALCHEVDW